MNISEANAATTLISVLDGSRPVHPDTALAAAQLLAARAGKPLLMRIDVDEARLRRRLGTLARRAAAPKSPAPSTQKVARS